MVHREGSGFIEEHAIFLSSVSKSLNNVPIIKNVSLAIPYNSVYAIIGPNGAGKTTLLRLMLGLLNLDEGTVRYNGISHQVAMLLEQDYLFEAKTARENINNFIIYFALNPDLAYVIVNKYLEALQLHTALDNKVATYSKGMKRKLSLLITLLRDTPIIFLDELTSGVDPESRRLMRDILGLLKAEGKTIILTSHDLAEVQKTSDWITMLIGGSVVETIDNKAFQGELEERFFEVLEGISG